MSLVHTARSFARGEYEADFESRVHDIAAGVSTDRLSRMELQLLPVVASALAAVLPDHPATSIAAGAKRRAAAEAMLAEDAAGIAASALADHGLTVAPLKGLALSSAYESLTWRRPMGDADLLIIEQVSWEDIDSTLTSSGFRRAPRHFHARNYALPDGRQVDLHRFVSTPNAFTGALSQALSSLVESPSVGSPLRVLTAEFHMAHAIEHAMRWNPILPARSISDIAAIQESTRSLDWEIVHALLRDWTAALNGRALIAGLVEADILSECAIELHPVATPLSDQWIQYLAPMDPRTSWFGYSASYFALIPWRLWRHGEDFSYREYLRSLWSLHESESLARATGNRIAMRLRYGRNFPTYSHE